MPRLKTENSIKKIECKINLSPDAKELLAQSARHLNLNQNQIVENLILNFHANNEIMKNSKYIIERENLLTEIVSRIEKSVDFEKKIFYEVESQNGRLCNIENSITNISNKIIIFKKDLHTYLDSSNEAIKSRIRDFKEVFQKEVEISKTNKKGLFN